MPVIDAAQSALAGVPVTGSPDVTAAMREAALASVLRSPVFQKNPRLSALLTYLCARATHPERESPKEYSIATDVFGRSAKFDSSTDSIVRVEMHRLRKKLREFYLAEGASERCQIVLEAGHYRPQWILIEAVVAADIAAEPPLPLTEVTPELNVPGPAASELYTWLTWQHCVLIAGVLACAAFGWVFLRDRQHRNTVIPPAIALADASDTVRILCGAESNVLAVGQEWGSDRYFTGGHTIFMPDAMPGRTSRPELYHAARIGAFRYDIPLQPGPHELRLHFAEVNRPLPMPLDGAENTRIFHVLANGALLLPNFDIAADSSANTADIKVFRNVEPARDGKLHLSFVKLVDEPLLNAIEIIPSEANRLHPICLTVQRRGFTDDAGQRWSADDFFSQGRRMVREENGGAATDAERYGNFSYSIPVASGGHYTVRLHFFEGYFGPALPGSGGAGSRVFDVLCNGQTLWNNLDVFAEAGAAKELIKTSTGVEPNAQGKIILSFVPVKNYAMVSAIELIDEGR